MEPPDPSFVDEFNVLQEYAVLVFDVRRAVVSPPFQVHRLKVLVEADLVTFSSACFEFVDGSPSKSSARQPCAPSDSFSSHLNGLSKVDIVGSEGRCLLTSSLCCHTAFISASSPGLTHQPCASCGRLKRGTISLSHVGYFCSREDVYKLFDMAPPNTSTTYLSVS